jgi:hypothetical protein
MNYFLDVCSSCCCCLRVFSHSSSSKEEDKSTSHSSTTFHNDDDDEDKLSFEVEVEELQSTSNEYEKSDHSSSIEIAKDIEDDEFLNDAKYDFYGVYAEDNEESKEKKKNNTVMHKMAISFLEIAVTLEQTFKENEEPYDDENEFVFLTKEEMKDFGSYSDDVSLDDDDHLESLLNNLEKAIRYCHDDERCGIILKYENCKEKYLSDKDKELEEDRLEMIQQARNAISENIKRKYYAECLKMAYSMTSIHQIKREIILYVKSLQQLS